MPLTIDQNLNPQKDNDSLAQVESQGDIRSIMAKIRNIYDQLKSSNPSQSQFLMQEITQLIIQVSSMPGGAEAISAFIEDAKAREQAIRTSAPTVAKLNQESVIGSGDNVTNDPQPTPEGMVLNMVVDVLKDMALSKAFDDIPQDETEVNATSKQAEKSEAVTEASAAVIRKYVAQYGEKALLNPAIAEKNNIRDTFLGPQIAAQMDAHRRKKQLEKGDAYMQTQSSEIRADIIEKRETRAKAREANDVDAEIVNSKGLFDSDELEFVVKAQSMPKKTKLSDEQVAK
jgi:hypothetical protein